MICYHVYVLVLLQLSFQEIEVFYAEYVTVIKLVYKGKASPFTKTTSTTGTSISFTRNWLYRLQGGTKIYVFFLQSHRDKNLHENFLRLYMDGLIAVIRKEDFVKKINLQDRRLSPGKCVGRRTAYQFIIRWHTYIKGEVNSVNTF